MIVTGVDGGSWRFSSLHPSVRNLSTSSRIPFSFLPLSLLASGLGIWGFIEIYILRGSPGTNRFGADPLAEPELASGRQASWDQQRELEFVPPSASPPDGMHVKRGA